MLVTCIDIVICVCCLLLACIDIIICCFVCASMLALLLWMLYIIISQMLLGKLMNLLWTPSGGYGHAVMQNGHFSFSYMTFLIHCHASFLILLFLHHSTDVKWCKPSSFSFPAWLSWSTVMQTFLLCYFCIIPLTSSDACPALFLFLHDFLNPLSCKLSYFVIFASFPWRLLMHIWHFSFSCMTFLIHCHASFLTLLFLHHPPDVKWCKPSSFLFLAWLHSRLIMHSRQFSISCMTSLTTSKFLRDF